jgi:hypothetical protein
MTKEDIQEYYKGTGNNSSDLMTMLKDSSTNGYEISDDESLGVFYFGQLVVIVNTGGVNYHTVK